MAASWFETLNMATAMVETVVGEVLDEVVDSVMHGGRRSPPQLIAVPRRSPVLLLGRWWRWGRSPASRTPRRPPPQTTPPQPTAAYQGGAVVSNGKTATVRVAYTCTTSAAAPFSHLYVA